MFTGIIEEIGRVRSIEKRSGYQQTILHAALVLEGMKVGDSVTLNGVCHTVVAFDTQGFTVESVAETLQRTTLGDIRVGDGVNLERALQLGDRLDGHLVAGHVDGVGRVLERQVDADNVNLRFEMPELLAPYVAEKGSVTIDGISLTVVSVTARAFGVTVIPHTLAVTMLSERTVGDRVNLEVDMIARYLERLVTFGRVSPAQGLTEVALKEMGYGG
ncbi:MAG: riboflavin synthase [bacterium]|nr:riboflavin synthase [bacterium]